MTGECVLAGEIEQRNITYVIPLWDDRLRVKIAPKLLIKILEYCRPFIEIQYSDLSKQDFVDLMKQWEFCPYDFGLPFMSYQKISGGTCYKWYFSEESPVLFEIYSLSDYICAAHNLKYTYSQMNLAISSDLAIEALKWFSVVRGETLRYLIQGEKFQIFGDPFRTEVFFPKFNELNILHFPRQFIPLLVPRFLYQFVTKFPNISTNIFFILFLDWVDISEKDMLKIIL